MTGRVIVVGSVNVDLVLSVDRLPAPGETVTGGRFARHDGGKGGNQAVAAARLGAKVAFIGAVGRDAFGDTARAALVAEGIDVGGLASLVGEATGVASIMVDRHGENAIAVAGGANTALTSVAVRGALRNLELGREDVVLVGHEIRTGAAHEALRLARIAGATTILNPAPARGLEPPTLALADILTPNRGELSILAGGGSDAPAAQARRVLKRRPEIGRDAPTGRASGRAGSGSTPTRAAAVIVTLGADGAILLTGGRAITIRANPAEAIDTVGAGDALNGALAAGLAAGRSLEDAARRAVMAAGLSVRVRGAREGLPTAAEIEASSG